MPERMPEQLAEFNIPELRKFWETAQLSADRIQTSNFVSGVPITTTGSSPATSYMATSFVAKQ